MQTFKLPTKILPKVVLGAKKLTNPAEITNPSGLLERMEELDGEVLVESLRSGTEAIEALGRKQLISITRHMGGTEEDTRGKPVKAMRELVTALLASGEEDKAEAQVSAPALVKPVTKLGGPVKLIRRLGT